MKNVLTVVLAVAALSCAADTDLIIEARPGPPAGYPFVVEYSPERLVILVEAWERFAAAYSLPPALPAFDSALMIPSLPPVDLTPESGDTVSLDAAYAQLASFMTEWAELFNTGEPFRIDDMRWNPVARSYVFSLSRSPPTDVTGLNVVGARITRTGILSSFTSTCLPPVQVPRTLVYTLQDALRAVEGKHLVYEGWAGRETIVITARMVSEAVADVKYIPTWTVNGYRRIECRFCWRLTLPVAYIYVDAVTGEFLDYNEQYVIF